MALPNKPAGELPATLDPAIVELDADILIVGGGMAACGTAYEIKKWAPEGTKILLTDKAALERSGLKKLRPWQEALRAYLEARRQKND